jgi:hypothetical protein
MLPSKSEESMRTDKQNEASRRNGGKSQGPVTEEGKANSAQNAVSHNICTGHLVLLNNEDPREFHRLMDDYILRFQPVDGVELDLVHKMIAATWREKRVTAMETALFELEILRQQPDVDDQYLEISPAARQCLALFGSDDTKSAAALLHRYGSTARRAYTSAFRALRELQGDRFLRPSLPVRALPPHIPAPHYDGPDPRTLPGNGIVPPPLPNAALANFIVLRRRSERLVRSKNMKLQNEPGRAMAAGQSSLHSLLQI